MATADPVPALRKVLGDDNQENLALRFRALFSLKHLARNGSKPAIEAIANAFSSKSALLKHELAYCLGQSADSYAAQFLQSILDTKSEDPMVRHEAAEALGALAHAESLPLLEKYLNDPEEVVRQTCELSIARINWVSSQKDGEGGSKDGSGQEGGLFAGVVDPAPPAGGGNVEELQRTLNDQGTDLFERYRVMFRLRDIGSKEAVDALASGFGDPSALFRHEIAFVFGQLSDPHSIPALIKVAGNKEEAPMVRHEAVEALGSIADESVDALLKEYAKDVEEVVRDSAVVALDMAEFERSGGFEYALIPGAA
ncbi:unnamed protein product [Tuber melanosporum]|uniref:Deoxyhypusine hydroxylase n=1 Tax=Tuber melanosporum (strain Mel28) TaxID=656061 RepID=D5GHJ2_TUBMM|nr:uncharacterized protein GSTUM_00007940001 [Tuber melanosporum]CAZ83985.1 unnamed protein product [Tuber melanosporum]